MSDLADRLDSTRVYSIRPDPVFTAGTWSGHRKRVRNDRFTLADLASKATITQADLGPGLGHPRTREGRRSRAP